MSAREEDRIGTPHRVAGAWLGLAVAALALSGIYALMLAIARSPVVGRLLPGVDFYHMALALHVNFAVVVWLLAFSGALWSAGTRAAPAWLRWTPLALAAAGALSMALSPLGGVARALLNNYVPIIDSPVFLTGISLLVGSLVVVAVTALVRGRPRFVRGADEVPQLGMRLATLPFLVAVVAFVVSLLLPPDVSESVFYEVILWGPGHILQFSYVLLMMSAWLVLAKAGSVRLPFGARGLVACMAATVAPALAAPLVYAVFPVQFPDFRQAFTTLMSWGTWPAAMLLGIGLAAGARQVRGGGAAAEHARACLMLSVMLFAVGCIAGAAITSNNVMVTSHYHGTTGAVSVALMGLALQLLPALGFRRPESRIVAWQPAIYAAGLLLMILGLLWSGGYNVQRKTPGSGLLADSLPTWLGLAVVGTGGMIAFIGTLAFALPVLRAMLGGERRCEAAQRAA